MKIAKKHPQEEEGKKKDGESSDMEWVHLCHLVECCRYMNSEKKVKDWSLPYLKDRPKSAEDMGDWTGGLRIVSALVNGTIRDDLVSQKHSLKDFSWLLSCCFECNLYAEEVLTLMLITIYVFIDRSRVSPLHRIGGPDEHHVPSCGGAPRSGRPGAGLRCTGQVWGQILRHRIFRACSGD